MRSANHAAQLCGHLGQRSRGHYDDRYNFRDRFPFINNQIAAKRQAIGGIAGNTLNFNAAGEHPNGAPILVRQKVPPLIQRFSFWPGWFDTQKTSTPHVTVLLHRMQQENSGEGAA